MAEIDVDESSKATVIDRTHLSEDDPSRNPRPQLHGLDESLAIGNAWFCYLPLEDTLGKRYKNLDLHLTKFAIPQIEMGSMDVSFRGYSKQMPTGVLNAATKELTLSYLVDEYWQNYKGLYSWVQSYINTVNPLSDDKANGISASRFPTMRIYLLNNYKKKILEFQFSNVWIRLFNDISLDVANQDQIEHSFTITYDDFQMVEI